MATVEALPKPATLLDRKVKSTSSRTGVVVFLLALGAGLGYIVFHVARDLDSVTVTSYAPYLLLALALLIALGFEFVNGFHDTANAVATVIYTHSLEPNIAVVWSGLCNLAGVLFSTGTVAFAVITLLPVELILQVSSGAGFSMVFALLIAAILWNLGTWWFGLPASSSHTMVGSIIGVGLANQFLNPHIGTSGVDWEQAIKVLKALLISPVVGFVLAGLADSAFKAAHQTSLSSTRRPRTTNRRRFPIRALMVLTCTGVSFFHGSNDGQKGMGLIMLILIGTVPTAYALNHAVSPAEVQDFIAASEQAGNILDHHVSPTGMLGPTPAPRSPTTSAPSKLQPDTILALRELVDELDHEVALYKELKVGSRQQTSQRPQRHVCGQRSPPPDGEEPTIPPSPPLKRAALTTTRPNVDHATKFIPDWVKVAVALALGLGTMVGWKRIVVTVGEKIGKEHLTYAQGASAGLVAMATIFAADSFGLPVSTTHILSSGVAGTMAANGSGLRYATVRNIAAGWVLTLPAAALLSGLSTGFSATSPETPAAPIASSHCPLSALHAIVKVA